jgi:hypothetical protein
LGQTVGGEERARLFSIARQAFDKAYRIHIKYGTNSQTAFDQLRKAQLLRIEEGDIEEIRRLLGEARSLFLFDEDRAVWHVDLEEARVILWSEGDIRLPMRKAMNALSVAADIKYPKGISDAIYMLGEIQAADGKRREAFRHYVASFVVYPYPGHLRNRTLWEKLWELHTDLKNEEGRGSYSELLSQLELELGSRSGYFAYLHSDRNAEVSRILRRLRSWKSR